MAASNSEGESGEGAHEPPGSWQQQLTTKNTFLGWPSPWIDANQRQANDAAESRRPRSDPTRSSSRSSSLSSSWDLTAQRAERTAGHQAFASTVQRLAALEGVAGRVCNGEADATTGQIPVWTPGAVGHEERKCNPCMFYCKFGACREGATCSNCHMVHEPKKKQQGASKRKAARRRPPARLRTKPGAAAAGQAPDDAGAESEAESAKQGKYVRLLSDLLERAQREGDAFVLDTTDYIPRYVKNSKFLREKFLASLEENRGLAGKLPAPSVSGPRAPSSPLPSDLQAVPPPWQESKGEDPLQGSGDAWANGRAAAQARRAVEGVAEREISDCSSDGLFLLQ